MHSRKGPANHALHNPAIALQFQPTPPSGRVAELFPVGGMKRALLICSAVVCGALIVGMYWRSPTRQASIGRVSLAFQGLAQGGEDKQGLFVLSNGGPYTLRCGVGTEVEQSGEWHDPPEGRSFDFASLPLLLPKAATTINVSPPSGTGMWRAVVQCERHYDDTGLGRKKRDFDWYVRKKAFIDTARSEGIVR